MKEVEVATLTEPTGRSAIRRWGPVAAAAAIWWVLYHYNLPFWDWVIYDVVGLDPESRLGESIHFFFYDVTKITLLLTGVIFVVTILRSFMSVERTRALLGGRREGVGNVAAAGLGVVTPFCSCSAVPVFIGFVAAGVPLGVTLSFLIASPMVNEVAIVLLFGLFGWQVTALYIARRAGHRHRRRHGARPDESRPVGRAVRVRDQTPRQADRPVTGPVMGRPHPDGPRRGRVDPAQGLAVPARRHRRRRR